MPCCMSTVTLSQPQPAITSAEKPDGMASQPLMQALPAAIRSLSLFGIGTHPRLSKRAARQAAGLTGSQANHATGPRPMESLASGRGSAHISHMPTRKAPSPAAADSPQGDAQRRNEPPTEQSPPVEMTSRGQAKAPAI